MTPEEYQKAAQRTECRYVTALDKVYWHSVDSSPLHKAIRLNHGAMGIVKEGGEILADLEKWIYYNQELNRDHIKEELGDVMWYVALVCNALGLSLAEVMEGNLAKLAARYPEKYTDYQAARRDKAKEEAALRATANSNKLEHREVNKTASCCKCGEDYPYVELDKENHVYCAKCRAVYCETKSGKHDFIHDKEAREFACRKCGYTYKERYAEPAAVEQTTVATKAGCQHKWHSPATGQCWTDENNELKFLPTNQVYARCVKCCVIINVTPKPEQEQGSKSNCIHEWVTSWNGQILMVPRCRHCGKDYQSV